MNVGDHPVEVDLNKLDSSQIRIWADIHSWTGRPPKIHMLKVGLFRVKVEFLHGSEDPIWCYQEREGTKLTELLHEAWTRVRADHRRQSA